MRAHDDVENKFAFFPQTDFAITLVGVVRWLRRRTTPTFPLTGRAVANNYDKLAFGTFRQNNGYSVKPKLIIRKECYVRYFWYRNGQRKNIGTHPD